MAKQIKIGKTQRGFKLAEFEDRYANKCSIQDSSLATEAAIWLGVDTDSMGVELSTRMHLTVDMVKSLLPVLNRFVETGTIGE